MSPLAATRTSIRAVFCSLLACVLTCAAKAQDKPGATTPPAAPAAAAAPPAGEPAKPVNFRTPSAGLNNEALAGEIPGIPTGNSHQDLVDRRDSLEGDIRYGKAKIDAGRKRVEILQAVGKNEEAERMNGELKDWEARIKNAREQLAQVEEELGKSQNADSAPMQSAEEIILPGNNLEVFVNEDTSYNSRYQVRRGGYIILPQVGRVLVAGKTINQAETAVRKALQATQLRHATVTIERLEGPSDEPGPMIYLSGEFRNPRPFRIPAGTAPTLISVMLSSGGWSDRADLTRVKVMRIVRNQPVSETVNVKKILSGDPLADLGPDLTLNEGDVVVLPSGSVNLIYVTGRVKKAGSYRVGDGEKLTAYGSILQSGGFDHFADKKKVHVLRSMPDGTKARLPMNIVDIEKGKRPDVVLQPNDIVVVPEKWFSW
jgi:polysaccharide export outer membrane protein